MFSKYQLGINKKTAMQGKFGGFYKIPTLPTQL
jgi:hypothetical protein